MQKTLKIAAIVLMLAAATSAQCGPAPKSPAQNPPQDTTPQANSQTTDKSKSQKSADDSTAFPEDISLAAEVKARTERNAESGQFPDTPEPKLKRRAVPENIAPIPPVNPNESSSKATKLEPLDDEKPGMDDGGSAESGVHEMHKFDPHRADKDVEVGKYYLTEKNYKGAIMRFKDALLFKPGDVAATRMLGQAFETTGRYDEALELYENYMKDFGKGPFAQQAQEGMERLKKRLSH